MGGERSEKDGKDKIPKNIKKILDRINKRYGNVLRRLAGQDTEQSGRDCK